MIKESEGFRELAEVCRGVFDLYSTIALERDPSCILVGYFIILNWIVSL